MKTTELLMNHILKDIAQIRSGYPFRKGIEDVSDGEYRVIQIKDLDQGVMSSANNLVQTNLPDMRSDYFVQNGDVLFASRGERRRAAVVDEDLPKTIFSAQLFACSTDERVLPAYLAWYINQTPAQRYLDEHATGSYIRNVTKDALAHLLVPVPPLETQHKIVEVYRLGLREKQLLEEIKNKRSQLVEFALLQSIHKS